MRFGIVRNVGIVRRKPHVFFLLLKKVKEKRVIWVFGIALFRLVLLAGM